MSPLAAASGLPLSSDSSSASSSPLALISSASVFMSPERFEGLTLRSGPSSAARAASTARRASSAPPWAASQIGSPVDGSIVSNVRPAAASGRSPPITRPCGPLANSRAASESDSAVAVAIAPNATGMAREGGGSAGRAVDRLGHLGLVVERLLVGGAELVRLGLVARRRGGGLGAYGGLLVLGLGLGRRLLGAGL